jgi:hypothetical protein
MSEPRRLLDRDGDGDGPAALLLSSARDDAPSAASFDRVALRLGVAGTVLGAAALTGGAATAATASTAASGSAAGAGLAAGGLPTGATAGLGAGTGLGAGAGLAGASAGASGAGLAGAGAGAAGATVAKVAGVSLFTKLVGIAAVGLAVTGGAAIAHHELGGNTPRPSVSLEAAPLVSSTPGPTKAPDALPTLAVPPVIEGTTTTAEAPKSAPEALEAPKPTAPSKPSSSAESPRETTLRDEVALLDRARAEIARGATGEALATLAKHDATFPRGFLGSEAEVLRIEALVRAGRTTEAKSRGEALLAREPNGPHAQRVRTLLDP